MTDNHQLLADYARTRSEAAFTELVRRYIDLVYSTAVRLTDGDMHLAEDVSQTVFLDLARMARRISSAVMLGGWLIVTRVSWRQKCCAQTAAVKTAKGFLWK